MDKKTILRNIFGREEVRDYTYQILFFLLASLFAYLIIKPALSIAFSLKREAQDLKNIREVYEKNRDRLVSLTTNLTFIRDKIYLLDIALPRLPGTKILIDDIKNAATENNLVIEDLNLSNVNLKSDKDMNQLKILSISMQTSGNFTDAKGFILKLSDQARLKTIKNLRILKEDKEASESGGLKVILELEGYYL